MFRALVTYLLVFCGTLFSQVNVDFELTAPGAYNTANAVSGWTVSSRTYSGGCTAPAVWTPGSPEFSVHSTPVFGIPIFSVLPQSPLGGNNIVQLNDYYTGTSNVTRLAQTFTVPSSGNCLFAYSVAGLYNSFSHLCCEQPNLNIIVKDCSGFVLPLLSRNLTPPGPFCPGSIFNFNITNTISWYNWQTFYLNLTPYAGWCLTIEIICNDCSDGQHAGSSFFDAVWLTPNGAVTYPGNPANPLLYPPIGVGFCYGSNIASINAPPGYASYSWICPGPNGCGPLQNSQLNAYTPIPGTVYTVNLTSYSGYTTSATYTLSPTQTSIVAINSLPSCPLASNGSATVLATGSGGGYTYSWYNSAGQLVATTQTVNNLSPGIYSVVVNGCSPVSATVAVGTRTANPYYSFQYYCNNQSAFLISPPGGSNYQWYDNLTAVTASLGGTATSYTAPAPTNGSLFRVAFTATTGCRDSVTYMLSATPPGTINIISNKQICQNGTDGAVSFSVIPAANSPAATNSFSVWSLPGPVSFSNSSVPSVITSFTINNLNAFTNYSISASDGYCTYSRTVTPNLYNSTSFIPFANTSSVCPGQSVLVQTSSSPTIPFQQLSQYTYTWSPSNFLSAVNQPSVLITPTAGPGINTLTYTVSFSNTVTNCPINAATLSVVVVNLPTPTISPIPNLCANSAQYFINANPPGGVFYNAPNVSPGGIITPPFVYPGFYSFAYSLLPNTCVASAVGYFTVSPQPTLSISGGNVICEGNSANLFAFGGLNFLWNNGATGYSVSVSPTTTTLYSVLGTNTITGCSALFTTTVSVNPRPSISVSGVSQICTGGTTTLTVIGTNLAYYWNTGSSSSVIAVTPSITTNYTVFGTNSNYCTNKAVITVAVDACTGIIQQEDAESRLIIYPNPTTGIFYVEVSSNTLIRVSDNLGRTILEQNFDPGKQSVDLSAFSNGVYFLKCGEKVIRVIKE